MKHASKIFLTGLFLISSSIILADLATAALELSAELFKVQKKDPMTDLFGPPVRTPAPATTQKGPFDPFDPDTPPTSPTPSTSAAEAAAAAAAAAGDAGTGLPKAIKHAWYKPKPKQPKDRRIDLKKEPGYEDL